MKSLLIAVMTTFLIFNFSFQVDAQKVEYQTVFVLTKIKKPDGNWSEWSEPERQHYPVLFDLAKSRIVISSPETQIFDFTSEMEGREYDQGGTSLNWTADKDGKTCSVQFYDGKFDNGLSDKALIIYYDQITYKYQLIPRDL